MLTVFSDKLVLSGHTNDKLMLLRKTKESILKNLWQFTAPYNKTMFEKTNCGQQTSLMAIWDVRKCCSSRSVFV